MKEDISLLNLNNGLCKAVERNGALCFGALRAREGKKNKYCTRHIQRYKKYGSVDLPIKIKASCKFIDCDNPSRNNGYCFKHYQKFVQVPRNRKRKCIVDDCVKKRCGTTRYCGMHPTRLRKYGCLEGSGMPRYRAPKGYCPLPHGRPRRHFKCIVPQCTKTFEDSELVKGLCTTHYQRWRRKGNYHLDADIKLKGTPSDYIGCIKGTKTISVRQSDHV